MKTQFLSVGKFRAHLCAADFVSVRAEMQDWNAAGVVNCINSHFGSSMIQLTKYIETVLLAKLLEFLT